MHLNKLSRTVVSLLTLVVFGCGGGGGTPGSATVLVKLATTGTLPAGTAIGGISARVLATPSTGVSIAADAVAATGYGAGSTLIANVGDPANVTIGLVNPTGIATGEFSTLSYRAATGQAGDGFSIAPQAEVVDTAGAAIPGIAVVVQGVTVH